MQNKSNNINIKAKKVEEEETLILYHNNRCAKSRQALKILENSGLKFDTIEYLKKPLTEKEIKNLLKLLQLNAENIIRKGELLYKEKFATTNISENEWIKILANNPVLIERPILVKGNKAILARAPEKILELLNT